MPDKFFDRVIESKFSLNIAGVRYTVVVLNLLDEVFVADLSESASFVGVKEDVVAPYFSAGHDWGCVAKFNVKFDFVVLKGN